MLSKKRTYQIIDFVLNEAKDYDTRVLIMGQAEGLTRYANSQIHQNVFEDVTTVDITVVDGNKKSTIATTLYDEEGLAAAVSEAIDNLSFLPEGQPPAPTVTSPEIIEAEDFDEELATAFNIENRAILVKNALDTLKPPYNAFGTLTYKVDQIAFGNQEGVKRFASGNSVSFSALIADDKGGTGFATVTTNRAQDIDVMATFNKAYTKAKLNQNPEQIEPGAYTVILEPLAVGDIATYLGFIGFSGKSVQNQMSFLTGKKGQQVFDERVTMIDDYTNEHTMTLPFDFEGYPRQQVTLIDKGVAKDLLYDAASARKDEVESTGHSVNQEQYGGMPLNLVMQSGDKSLAKIIKETDKGLLITRFHYMNVVNPRNAVLTALTRDGVFKIENGEIVGAVKNMRFTESMLTAFNNIAAIASDRERTPFFFGNFYMPGMKINDFHFTGKTE